MFLMPPKLVKHAIGQLEEPLETAEGLRALAEILQVSPRAAVEHLDNLTLMDESVRDELVGQMLVGR